MSISMLYERCAKCKDVNNCDKKKMAACAYLTMPEQPQIQQPKLELNIPICNEIRTYYNNDIQVIQETLNRLLKGRNCNESHRS